ncbi:hypothetical protein NC653_035292 [Populus alba x Populus x berolinensis]|uniref:Uncharacterized protein n=1 Tax=Populus alba x Populus x berolinensis TaxID=444605 RepID=A0AAD6LQ57_9ROSI|nr:hypothetical protein NC653_035292 [Populus alba x Populus x berolinensis]
MMRKILVAVLIVSMVASHFENVASDASDCDDACTTGCVQSNTRLMRRCDIKCGIRCGPDSEVEDHTVLIVFVLEIISSLNKERRESLLKLQLL